ncbi:MAG: hypothetical protein O2856_19900 [Planctomycetota bacterium]|nr:hypothetical protein [Planctomycetota bacterium]
MQSSKSQKPQEFSPVTIGVAFVLLSGFVVFLVGLGEPDVDEVKDSQGTSPPSRQQASTDVERSNSGTNESQAALDTRKSQGTREYGPRPLLMPAKDREFRTEDGKLVARSQFQKDQSSGQFTFFHSNGWAAVDGPQKDGLPHGLWKAWHQNGTIAMEGEFRNGLRHGAWMYYDTAGLKKRREIYNDDRPEGVWIYWDEKGKVWWRRDWARKKA